MKYFQKVAAAIAVTVLCLSSVQLAAAQEPANPAPAAEQAAPAVQPAAPDVSAERLSRKQKRDLGILPIQVLSRARQMAKDGEISKDMTPKEMAFCYASNVASSQEFGGAWNQVSDGTYGVDWDGIIAFLERLFELLMKFLPLFI